MTKLICKVGKGVFYDVFTNKYHKTNIRGKTFEEKIKRKTREEITVYLKNKKRFHNKKLQKSVI